ncbi:MAG: hypothetical protein U0Z26_09765 [Anaerolineales bacterium]
MKTLGIKSGQGDYQVEFFDSIQDLVEIARRQSFSGVVIDENVERLYRDELKTIV